MVKSKLIMKKKPMNAMEAYRKKEKNKERLKNKRDKHSHRDNRNKAEEEKPQQKSSFNPPYGKNEDSDGFEGEEDLLEFNSALIQQKLQEKQRLRELRFDDPATKNSIQDLAQSFTKKAAPLSQQQKPISSIPSNPHTESAANYQSQAPSGLSSFMSDNIFRSQNIGGQNPTNQSFNPSKTTVGDKRLQKRDGAGPVDPFMMTTLQGNYDPTARNKNKQAEDPMLGNYVSQAPGVYKALEKPKQQPIAAGPTVIVKEAALTSAPLRSQMEKEKSSLIPMNVVKKKPVKPANEEGPKTNQSTMNIGIMNVTNVPAPKTNFGFSQSIQQNAAQKEQLSAFLQEISQLEDGS